MKILLTVLSYLGGAFPTGYILFYLNEKKDIRKFGSKTTGATNVLRLKGWKFALPVLIIDFLKGFLPVYLAFFLFQDQQLALLCALLAVAGHCFPLYIGFKGGKGIATTMGVFSALAFKPFLLSLALFLLIAALSRYVSLGSLISVLSFPVFILIFHRETDIFWLALILFTLIAWRHRGNIQRIIKGQERKIGEKNR